MYLSLNAFHMPYRFVGSCNMRFDGESHRSNAIWAMSSLQSSALSLNSLTTSLMMADWPFVALVLSSSYVALSLMHAKRLVKASSDRILSIQIERLFVFLGSKGVRRALNAW